MLYLNVCCCTLLYVAVPCCTLLYVVVRCCTLLYLACLPVRVCVSEVKPTLEVNMDLVSRPNCTHTHTHTHTHTDEIKLKQPSLEPNHRTCTLHLHTYVSPFKTPHCAHTNLITIPSRLFTPAPAVQSTSTSTPTSGPYPPSQSGCDRHCKGCPGTNDSSTYYGASDVVRMVVPCTVLYCAVPCCTLMYLDVPCCTLLYLAVRCPCAVCVREAKTKVAANSSLV